MSQLNLEVTLEETTATLNWTLQGSRPFTQIKVVRDSQVIATLPSTVYTYTDSSLVAGAVYTYLVRGLSGNKIIAISNSVKITVPTAVVYLTAPVLTGTAGDAQCSLSWTAVLNATSYELQRKAGAGAYSEINDANVLSFSDTGRTNTTTYTYRVRGTAGTSTGPWSNERALIPQAALLVAPVLTGEAGDSENVLDWNVVAGAATYRLRYRLVPGGTLTLLPDTDQTTYTDDSATNGETRYYDVRGITATNVFGPISNEVELTPEPVSPPEIAVVVGYGATTTGGTGGTLYTVSTYAEFAARCNQTGARIVKINPAVGDLNGLGVTLGIQPSQGNLTIDGTGWSGTLKRCNIVVKASNVIIKQMRIRPGADVDNEDSGGCITINPGLGNTLSRVLIDHNSLQWATDVALNHFQEGRDITIQHNIIGPSIRWYKQDTYHPFNDTPAGTINENGYGFSFHTDVGWVHNCTVYRNFIVHNNSRNLRGHGAINVDFINNVVYNWGKHLAVGNFRGVNMIGNMCKPGPDTLLDRTVFGEYLARGFMSELTTQGVPETAYHQNTTYFPDAQNLAMGFTFDHTFQPGVRRTAPWGTPSVIAQTPTVALANAIVAASGPTIEDSYDQQWKAEYLEGTGSNQWSEAGLTGPDIPW